MTLRVSCAFPPSVRTPDHVALAEQLGYASAWVYDSPAAYADPWMILALAARQTSTIGLGPAVLVPSLRHPLVNASAIATLSAVAPGRVAVAFGTGMTGRMMLGERPMRWVDVAEYVRAVRALLRGDQVRWQGRVVQMLQTDDFVPPRPLSVRILLGADGPIGTALADEIADGVFASRAPAEPDGRDRAQLIFGTVLDADETLADPRVVAAAGPAVVVAYHAIYESRGAAGVDRLPGGAAWREQIESIDPERRHLAVHEGHLVSLSDRDELIMAEAGNLVGKWTTTGSAAQVRSRIDALAEAGIREVAYQPIGPDLPRELSAFARAAGITT
jgi:5,10-methylenetetrahydromethanopterin reductase